MVCLMIELLQHQLAVLKVFLRFSGVFSMRVTYLFYKALLNSLF